MYAAWKKKNERNEIVCFHCTQSDILLCGIAKFSRGNKNKLRTFQPQKWKKIKSSQPQTKFTGFYKKRVYFEEHLWMSASKLYLKRDCNTGVFLWTLLFKSAYFVVDLQIAGSETPMRVSLWILWNVKEVFFAERLLATTSHRYCFFLFCRPVRFAASSEEQW